MARDTSEFKRMLSTDFLARVWARAEQDEIFGRAAQLSYYFLFALFPLLFFLITLFGYLSGAGTRLHEQLINNLGGVMPSAAVQLVVATIAEVTRVRSVGKLSFGLLATLWAASSGVNAIGQALNAAYDVPETRPWWKVRLISVTLTVALATLIVSALLLVLYGGQVGHFLAVMIHLGRAFSLAWQILQWPISLTFVFIAFSLLYQFAPNVGAKRRGKRLPASDYRRRWLSPGVGGRRHVMVARLTRLPTLSAFFQFIQRPLRLAGRADQYDVVVLSHGNCDSFGRRDQSRVRKH